MLDAGVAECRRLFMRQVSDDESVDADSPRLLGERGFSEAEDGIVVTHQNDRGASVGAKALHELEYLALRGRASLERRLGCLLDRRSVGDRIRKGNANLDPVGATPDAGANVLFARLSVRIACGEINREQSLSLIRAAAKRQR